MRQCRMPSHPALRRDALDVLFGGGEAREDLRCDAPQEGDDLCRRRRRCGVGQLGRDRDPGLLICAGASLSRAAAVFGCASGSLDLDFVAVERRERRAVTRRAARRPERGALDRCRDGAIDGCGVRAGAQAYLGPRPGVGSRPVTGWLMGCCSRWVSVAAARSLRAVHANVAAAICREPAAVHRCW